MSESTITADVTIDSRGATCPGPLMDLIGKVKKVDTGTVIELQTSDRGSTTDVPEWIEKAGHELLDSVEHDDYWSLYVETR
ncbi:sulfurtransferase TusA family protein [Haloarculaceae archaeon H-GB2-1]|nr:sulfurtransferase TusA family protein [Haloarculaceae archaeon H-GB1-1]MEA5389029.1 sulfurtransferase TusA family protein [Haloarculaceae archaeon H-GB11]MEA5407089.1 sulfurtransferase TusA family protein [Haloarculaceae archaeon H-GB2-1]